MLCKNCIAYKDKCLIKESGIRCELSLYEIQSKLNMKLKTDKLDKIAREYKKNRDKNTKEEWFKLIRGD